MTMYTAEPRIDRPCPSWCELEPGHGWDSIDTATGRDVRGHGRDLGPHTSLYLDEFKDEPLSSQPIGLIVSVDEPAMTAAHARQVAAELLNAADELDKVTR